MVQMGRCNQPGIRRDQGHTKGHVIATRGCIARQTIQRCVLWGTHSTLFHGEKIILDIYALVDPLDQLKLDNGSIMINPASLSVDAIDPEVISVQWFVDNMLVAGASGKRLTRLTSAMAQGHIYGHRPCVRSYRF